MTISTLDLLYAHGCLCNYARTYAASSMYRQHAERLCEVINSFQHELKDNLVVNHQPFIVVNNTVSGYFHVEPTGVGDVC